MTLAYQLKEAGAVPLLQEAATIVEHSGLAKGVVQNLKTGELDAFGALCVASGAKPKMVTSESPDECGVPANKMAVVFGCMEAIEATVGADIAVWSDKSTPEQVSRTFRLLADRIQISVI